MMESRVVSCTSLGFGQDTAAKCCVFATLLPDVSHSKHVDDTTDTRDNTVKPCLMSV